MRIKMTVTDLDGTLFGADSVVSDRTKATLAKCRTAGIKIAYATARGSSAQYRMSDVPVDGQIRMNGAIAQTGEFIVYKCFVPHLSVRELLLACDSRGIKITVSHSISGRDIYFVNSHRFAAESHQILTDFAQFDKDCGKIYMVGLTPDDEAFITNNLPSELYFLMARGDEGFGMIMHKNATKAKATAALAAHWGISPDEIVAFGDDLNDLDLLDFVGIGVAMDNALDVVKAAADYVCCANTENGVAQWLEEHVL